MSDTDDRASASCSTSPSSTRWSPPRCPTVRRWSAVTAASPTASSPSAPAGWPPTCSTRASAATPSAPSSSPTSPARTTWRSTSHNGNEYLEGMLGAYKARVAPFNVNYRYVEEELRYLLARRRRQGHRLPLGVRPDPRQVLRRPARRSRSLLQVADDSGHALLPGAVDYEEALAASPPEPARRSSPRPTTSTSSTRAARRACPRACCGARPTSSGRHGRPGGRHRVEVDRPRRDRRERPPTAASGSCRCPRSCTAPPTGWRSDAQRRQHARAARPRTDLDPADVWSTVEREQVQSCSSSATPSARPLARRARARRLRPQLDAHARAAAAPRSAPTVKDRFLELLPNAADHRRPRLVGDRRAGGAHCRPGGAPPRARSRPGPGMCIVSEDLDRVLEPGARGHRLAGPGGPGAARLPRRRRQDGPHLPGDRRRALLGPRRPGQVHRPTASSTCWAATR